MVGAAGAGAQVTISESFIEAPLILANEGAVVTLLNWGVNNFTQSQPLLVNVSGLGWRPKTVELAHSGPVAFTVTDDVLHAQVVLEAADFLMLRK